MLVWALAPRSPRLETTLGLRSLNAVRRLLLAAQSFLGYRQHRNNTATKGSFDGPACGPEDALISTLDRHTLPLRSAIISGYWKPA
ncbi:hypothetical protein [Bradyrhizobium sp. WSM2793]|uniref:hypothetical protein n=1 Tax=Bradyrhizobium sp. WSM2793 TaxID=1038866 RepID=UPI00039D202F|nr:hypothetical protein [Bradyrhizobium sp. WSM2793]